jgi:hypothetical protein
MCGGGPLPRDARQGLLGSAAIPPKEYAGLIVVRLPGRFQLTLLERALALVVEAAKQSDVRGRLWIAEVDLVREYQERVE